ncbi:MAG: hypothetical protein A2X02_06420 [Bacteroidetes bacterium GWF2_29_10]|nr:MAG: hypothetical protein A2X02_06420 [Bacteroidetes bacterium GWF2_29_10]
MNWLYIALIAVIIGIQFLGTYSKPKEIDYDTFEKKLFLEKDVEKLIIVNKESAEVYIKKDKLKTDKYKEEIKKGLSEKAPQYVFSIGTIETLNNNIENTRKKIINQKLDSITKANKLLSNDSLVKDAYISETGKESLLNDYRFEIRYEQKKDWTSEILGWVLPLLLLIGVWIFMFRKVGGGGGGGQIFNFGKSKATLYDKAASIQINFNDVAGLEEAKVEIMEIVDFLKNPKKYTELGGKIPKGALLVGPPGTGKTLLAKAVAGEAQVPFFSLSGSDFVEMFVGVGASRVRDLFKQAKEKAPCIIFIDEIDAIGRARGKNLMQSNDERENTLNQLLTEMDGFSSNSGVIILAATNRADVLDKALLRAGRFDRQIHVELPDLEERKAIFKVHLKPIKSEKDLNVDFLARHTPGFSGADIANVCNEAALIAARKNHQSIVKQDFLDAIDRIVAGLEKRNKIISDNEKKVIAYHEAGHATVSWLLEYANPLIKVTIVPRGKSLGSAWYLPEERQILTTEQILDEMCATLGGRASEDLIFNKISTGALNDLERTTKQAYAIVSIYGMNKEIGNLSYYDSGGSQEYSLSKPYSDKTAEKIDIEVKKIIEEQYDKAREILSTNIEGLKKIAEELLSKEVIYKEDLENILGKRPFGNSTELYADDTFAKHNEQINNNITKEEKISDKE